MNIKKYYFITFLFWVISIAHATPDRERYVIDHLIGLNGNNMIVYQIVYDNLGSHYMDLFEEYLIEKYMENGRTTIIDMVRITEQNSLESLLLQKYNNNILRIIPAIYYNKQSILENGYLQNRYRYNLVDYIPNELRNCEIINVVDIYFNGRYIYLTIDLKDDGTNYYRKIIMIRNSQED